MIYSFGNILGVNFWLNLDFYLIEVDWFNFHNQSLAIWLKTQNNQGKLKKWVGWLLVAMRWSRLLGSFLLLLVTKYLRPFQGFQTKYRPTRLTGEGEDLISDWDIILWVISHSPALFQQILLFVSLFPWFWRSLGAGVNNNAPPVGWQLAQIFTGDSSNWKFHWICESLLRLFSS